MFMHQSTLEEKFKSVASDNSRVLVEYPGYEISERPLHSAGYQDCNGIALLGNNVNGLTHFMTDSPEDYLAEVIKRMEIDFNEDDLNAVVMGGSPTHFERAIEYLKSRSVPIIGTYSEPLDINSVLVPTDGEYWPILLKIPILGDYLDRRTPKEIKQYVRWSAKGMVIIPDTKEVIMYSNREGYFQLSPQFS